MNSRATWVRVAGPLARYRDGFEAALAERGLSGRDLASAVVEEFLRARRAAGYRQWLSMRGMAPLLGYLRQGGVAAASAPAVAVTPGRVLLDAYRVYLVEERGLARPPCATTCLSRGSSWRSGTRPGTRTWEVRPRAR